MRWGKIIPAWITYAKLIIWSINTAIPQRDTSHLFHIFNQAVCILPPIVCVSFIILAFCSLYYTLQGHSISSYSFLKTQIDGISIYLLNIYCQGFQCQKLGTKTKYVFHIIPHLCKFLVFSGFAQAYSTFFYTTVIYWRNAAVCPQHYGWVC